jgi:hypothetical protein
MDGGAGQAPDAEGRELVGRNVTPHVARLGGCGHQVSNHLVDLLLGSPHPIVAVEELAEPRLLMSAGVSGEEGVGLQDGTEALHRAVASVPDFGQVCEVGLDLKLARPGTGNR